MKIMYFALFLAVFAFITIISLLLGNTFLKSIGSAVSIAFAGVLLRGLLEKFLFEPK